MPAWTSAPVNASSRARSDGRVGVVGPSASDRRSCTNAPDRVAQVLHVGIGRRAAPWCTPRRARARSTTSRPTSRMAAATRAAGPRRRSGRNTGSSAQPAPEHLGDEVVLGREVRVRGGRRHAGPPGHVAHGQAGVAMRSQLVERGVGQPLDRIGLAPAELPAGRLGQCSRPPDWTSVQTVVWTDD